MGRHGHGPKKHGTSPARPARQRARAWHGPQPCPCLGRTFGPWASTRHGTEKGLARHRHGFEPSWPLDPPTPAILAVGFRRWGGGVYKQRCRPAPPRTPNPKSFSPFPRRALLSLSLSLALLSDSDGAGRLRRATATRRRPHLFFSPYGSSGAPKMQVRALIFFFFSPSGSSGTEDAFSS